MAARTGTFLLLVWVLACFHWVSCDDGFPAAFTIYGTVKGKSVLTSNGAEASVFLGIPYATPPINERRFEVPQAPETWDGVRECTEHAPRCIQMNHKVDYAVPPPAGDSEDCLTLNVFTSHVDPSQNHPVMLFIHGGAFHVGSAFDYGVEGVVDNLVSKGVVVVVIQYRLGLFGFVSTNNPAASGNWGLWDQVEALKWVRDNIAEFGGDPQRVTIFGEVSVSLLSYIPLAQEYFHQTIEQSGSGYTFLAVNDDSAKATSYLAAAVECPTSPEEAMVTCLRDVPSEKLLAANRKLFESGYKEGDAPVLRWSPTIDGYLIPDSMTNLAMTLQAKPAIIGTTNLEMAFFLTPPPQMEMARKVSPSVLPNNFSLSDFEKTVHDVFPERFYPNSVSVLKKLCRFLYLEKDGDPTNQTFVIQQYMEMLGDLWFHAPATKEATDKVQIGSKVWMYSFDYYSQHMFPRDYMWKGAHHTFELYYLFNIDFQVFKFERQVVDKNVSSTVSSLWTNFAKFGAPCGETESETDCASSWPTFKSYEDSPTLHIGARTEVRRTFHQAGSVFWNKLIRQVEEISAVTQENTRPEEERIMFPRRDHEEL